MPKAFDGERPIPFPIVKLRPLQVTEDSVKDAFRYGDAITICVVPDEIEALSLGYIVNIKKEQSGFRIENILHKKEVHLSDFSSLIVLLKHVSGLEYSSDAQRLFQQRRNSVGIDVIEEEPVSLTAN